MVNFEWYRTFVAIYQQGNLTRAAEQLLISQSSASVQLSALESYIGKKLFDRQPRKLIPTEFGKRLYTQVINAVNDLEKVESAFKIAHLKKYKLLRIGSPVEYFYNNFIDLIKGRDDIDFDIRFDITAPLIDSLLKGELDFVFATQRIVHANLIYEEIKVERFMIVGSADYDTTDFDLFIEDRKFEEAERWLLHQPWIVYDNKLSLIRRFWRHNFGKRPLIKPHLVVSNINIICKAVAEGMGISVISDLSGVLSLKDGSVKKIWDGKIPSLNTLYLAYRVDVDPMLLVELKSILKI